MDVNTPFAKLQSKCEDMDVAYETLEIGTEYFIERASLVNMMINKALREIHDNGLPELFVIIRVVGPEGSKEMPSGDLHASSL